MPCLWPSPERGRTTAASPGSPRWIAMPLGTSSDAPGASVSGWSRQARRSSPAAPAVAYCGSDPRRRASSTLTSRVFKRLAPRQHLGDVLDERSRQGDLRRARQLVHAGVVEQRERVGVLAEGLVREIRREQGNALLPALRLRVGHQILGLGGEADAEWSFQRSDVGEDVRVRSEVEVEMAVAALDLE